MKKVQKSSKYRMVQRRKYQQKAIFLVGGAGQISYQPFLNGYQGAVPILNTQKSQLTPTIQRFLHFLHLLAIFWSTVPNDKR